MGALVAIVAEKGYSATRVKDLIELAAVSRSTFYKHFRNKEDCFLATFDAILELAAQRMRAERGGAGSWDRHLDALLGALARLIVEQPSAARITLVEVYAAGAQAIDRLERASDGVERAVMRAIRESPRRSGLPRAVVRGVIGGLRLMVLTRLRESREQELRGLVPGVLDWALRYETPPEPLRQPRRVPADVTAIRPTARADDDPRRRIFNAVTDLLGECDYADMTINDIVERAAMSLTTFYDHFDSAEEAFLATLDDAQQRLLDATLPAYLSTDDWPRAINAASRTFIGFLATDPMTAHLGGVAVWSAGSAGFELRARGRANFEALLARGFELHSDVPPIAAEAIGASVDALLFDQLRRAGAKRLYELAPTGVFLVLAPFIGSEAATDIANEAPIVAD
jgi:AcrR family transcriptional regulator